MEQQRILRQAIARIEGRREALPAEAAAPCPFGIAAVDAVLEGGLTTGALHEFTSADSRGLAAATGLVAGLLAGAEGAVLWITTLGALRQGGFPYAVGLDAFGIALDRLTLVCVKTPAEAMWAAEEAMKCPAVAATILELPDDGKAADLTATRRLSLAAREGGGLGCLIRHHTGTQPSAAATRWTVAPAPSLPDRFGGLGLPRLDLRLTKNRRGLTGRWAIAWNRHDQRFILAAPAVAVAAPAADRPDRAPSPLARAG